MLVAGQHGDPRDWLAGDRLQSVMDGVAAHHSGLAPVVVVPDALGAQRANPICVHSSLGRTHICPRICRTRSAAGCGWTPTPALGDRWLLLRRYLCHSDGDQPPQRAPELRGHLRPARTDPRVAAAADREQPVRRGPCPVHRDQLHRPAGEEELPGPSGWFSVRSPGTPSTVLSSGWMFGVAKGAGMDVRFWHRPGDAHEWNTCVTGAHPRDALDGSTTEYHPMIRGPGVASGPSRVGTLATSACAPGIDTGGDRPAG